MLAPNYFVVSSRKFIKLKLDFLKSPFKNVEKIALSDWAEIFNFLFWLDFETWKSKTQTLPQTVKDSKLKKF